MRKMSKYWIGASSVALAIASPAAALAMQDEVPGEASELTAEQQSIFDTWPPDQQLAYGAWPQETKDYFWTLPSARQDLFWRLSDDDKIALSAMGEEQREMAWQTLEARASNAPAEEPADQPPMK